MHGALRGAPAHHRLELARQVGERRVAHPARRGRLDLRRGVDHLTSIDARQRAAQNHPGRVAAGLGAGQADRVQGVPDGRHVLDPDPVVLDVLPVGEVGGAPGVAVRDVRHGAQLVVAQLAAVDPHPEHEVPVVELFRLERPGLPAVDAGAALRVQAIPAEPAAQVGRVDGVEALLGVDVDDPLTDVQPVVVLLVFLVLVQRLAISEGPLALAFTALPSQSGGWRHLARPFSVRGCAPRAAQPLPAAPVVLLAHGTLGLPPGIRHRPRHAPVFRAVVSGRADRLRCAPGAG